MSVQIAQHSVVYGLVRWTRGDRRALAHSFLGTAFPEVFADGLVLLARRRHRRRCMSWMCRCCDKDHVLDFSLQCVTCVCLQPGPCTHSVILKSPRHTDSSVESAPTETHRSCLDQNFKHHQKSYVTLSSRAAHPFLTIHC